MELSLFGVPLALAGWLLTGLASLAVLALARRKCDPPPDRG